MEIVFSLSDISYLIPFQAKQLEAKEGQDPSIKVIRIAGVAIDTSINKNHWQVDREHLIEVARTIIGKQIRVDHGDKVEDVKGSVTSAKVEGDQVLFEGEVATADPNVYVPIVRGYVNHVSVGIKPKSVTCAKCGVDSYPIKRCDHLDYHDKVAGIDVHELSLTSTPAYDNTEFKPTSFFEAMDYSRKEKTKMAEEKKVEQPSAPAPAPALFDAEKFSKDLLASVREVVKTATSELEAKFEAKMKPEQKEEKKETPSPELNASEKFKNAEKPNGAGKVAAEQPKPDRRTLEASAVQEIFKDAEARFNWKPLRA